MGAALANDVPMVSDDAPNVVTSRMRPARGLGPGWWPLGGVSTPSAWGGAGGAPGGPEPHAVSEPPAMVEYESEDDDEESLAGNLSHSSLASGGKQRQHTDHTDHTIEIEEQYDHPLMKRIFSSRAQTRLWDRFAKASGWSTWHDIPSSDRQDMLEKFEATFATYSWWNTVLGPTLNQVTPFGEIEAMRIECMLGSHSRTLTAEKASISEMTRMILQDRSVISDVCLSERWSFLASILGRIEAPLAEKLFRRLRRTTRSMWNVYVQRRLVLRLPSFDPQLGQVVQKACVTAFKKLKTPRGLRDRYGKAISVIPDPGPTVQPALSTGKQRLPAQLLSQGLTTVQNATNFATEHSLSESCMYWTADSTIMQQLSSPLQGAAHTVLKDTPCQCPVIRERYGTTVGGCTDHVVLRSHCDWKALYGPDFVDVLTANARNQLKPDSDSVSEKMDGCAPPCSNCPYLH